MSRWSRSIYRLLVMRMRVFLKSAKCVISLASGKDYFDCWNDIAVLAWELVCQMNLREAKKRRGKPFTCGHE